MGHRPVCSAWLGCAGAVPARSVASSPRARTSRAGPGRKLLRMEDFYRWQRRRLGVLVDGNGRVGERGTSITTTGNRRRRSGAASPPPALFAPATGRSGVIALVDRHARSLGGNRWIRPPGHAGAGAGDTRRLPGTSPRRLRAVRGCDAVRGAVPTTTPLSAAMNVGLLSAPRTSRCAR